VLAVGPDRQAVTRPVGKLRSSPCSRDRDRAWQTSAREHTFATAQGSPLPRLRRALAGGDLLAARAAAGELPHVGLDEAAALLVLIASSDPAKLDAAAVRFLRRVC